MAQLKMSRQREISMFLPDNESGRADKERRKPEVTGYVPLLRRNQEISRPVIVSEICRSAVFEHSWSPGKRAPDERPELHRCAPARSSGMLSTLDTYKRHEKAATQTLFSKSCWLVMSIYKSIQMR